MTESKTPLTDSSAPISTRESDQKLIQDVLKETSRELQQTYQDMMTVSEISREMISARSVERILELLFEAVGAFLPGCKCAFLEWDPLSSSLYCKLDQGLHTEQHQALRQHRDDGYDQWALQERRTMVIPEVIECQGESISSIVVPLIGSVETLGVVEIFSQREIGEYTQRDLSLITTIANQAAVAMENARLYAQTQIKTEAISRMKNYLTNILQSIGTGMIVLDIEGRITLFNHAAERLFGISADAAVGSSLSGVFSDEALATVEDVCQQALRTYQEAESEFVFKRPKHELPLGVSSSLLRDEDGAVLGVMLFFSDLTETKELMNLRRIDKLKDQFITTVSHELRTPLTAIKSFAEILLSYEEEDPETQREFLTIINDQSDHLTHLIDEILELSKIESGTAKWHIDQLDLAALVRHAVSAAESSTSRKDIRVRLKVDDTVPPVWGDEEKLTQVVMNLLDNAVKFTPSGGEIKVSVSAAQTTVEEEAKPAVQIAVRDNGPGIPPQHVDRIFDKFHQVGDMLTDKPRGTGLGLAISREIVQHLGGRIWAESKPGKGATLYVLLPACEGTSFHPHSRPSSEPDTPLPVTVI
jgi:PAS domain S-box-containing protein